MSYQHCEHIEPEQTADSHAARAARRQRILSTLDRMQREDGYYSIPRETGHRSPWQAARDYFKSLLRA